MINGTPAGEKSDKPRKSTARKFIFLLLYFLASGLVLFIFIVRPGINGYDRAMFPDMVYGRAHKPFVYRTLLPTTVRIVAEITPERIKDRMRSAVQEKRILRVLGWEQEFICEYLVAVMLMFCCFCGFAFMTRRLIQLFYSVPTFVADLAPVGGLILLPTFFRYYNYIYDPSTLFLFTLAIVCIAMRRRAWFYAAFLLAAVNKETSILLVGIFFLHEFKTISAPRLIGHLLLQTTAWVGVKGSISAIFKNNPGTLVESHLLGHNVDLLSNPPALIYFIVMISIFSALIHYRWAQKPVFLRRSLFITLLPLLALALFFGYIDELRMYYEAFPFIFLLSLHTIVDIFEITDDAWPLRERKD